MTRIARWLLLAAVAVLAAGCGATEAPVLRMGIVADTVGWGEHRGDQQDLARATGARWLREELSWARTEPRPGEFHWERFDLMLDAAARRGLRVLPLLNTAPDWAKGPDGGLPDDPAAYARFTRAAVARYGPAGTFWRTRPGLRPLAPAWFELWNEPWFVTPGPVDVDARRYAHLAAAATTAAHAQDPGARVLLAMDTATGARPGEDERWLHAIRDAEPGLLHAVDAVAAHPYAVPPSDGNRPLDRLLSLLGSRGVELPVWVTEMGWSTCAGVSGCVSEAGQARRLAAFMQDALRHRAVQAVFVYHLRSWGRSRGDIREGSFGLLRPDGSRKPAWGAFHRFTALTTG